MLVLVQNLGVRRIIPTSDNITGRGRENVMRAIKLICRCRMLLIKTSFKILKYLLKLYSSSTETTCNLKTIDIEMDPPVSLSVSVTASSPISGYWSINRHAILDVFMLLNCPRCFGTQCLKLCDSNEKKTGMRRHLQLTCTVCLYSHTFFTLKQVDPPKKNKGQQKLYNVNIRAIYGSIQVDCWSWRFKETLLLFKYTMLSNNYQNISLKIKESAKCVVREKCVNSHVQITGSGRTVNVGVSVDGTLAA